MKKQYKRPNIRVIELEASQSVLQTCKIGGQYFNIAVSSFCVYSYIPTEGPPPMPLPSNCRTAVKGKAYSPYNFQEAQSMPS